jgi:PEP-CTERM/exosortase A-associated glycosyltransferase
MTRDTDSLVSPDVDAEGSRAGASYSRPPQILPSSLRILHVLDHTLPLHSGYTFRTQNILEEQRRRGWVPLALTSSKHEASWKAPSPPDEEINGIRYYRTGALHGPAFPFDAELRIMTRLARRLEQVCQTEKPQLLHAHSPVLNALPAMWVGRKLGIPVVYEIRAFWEDAGVDHRSYSEGSLKYRMIRSLETWTCHHAAQIAVLCNGLKDDLIRRGIPAERMTVVWNGVNPEDFRVREYDLEFARSLGLAGNKVLGYIGSFYRYEGLDLLVSAFAKVAATRNDVALILAGGGEMEHDLREQVEQLGLRGKVVFPGRIAHDRIPSVYSMIDVLVYPRYSMRLTELVTPLKPLEAMAMGKPLVASDVGGHRELIEDNRTGLLFKAGSVSALAGTLERLLDDPVLRERLADCAIDWVRRNHTWKATTSVYSEIYAKALHGPR